MSRSNPTTTMQHVCTRWFEWDGTNGVPRYWDKNSKAAEDESKYVSVKLPFTFILLDELATVKGFSDEHEASLYANEVRNVGEDVMTVKIHGRTGVMVQGLYANIKDQVVALGGKYTASVYIAFKTATGLAIGNIQFKGASLGPWIEFCKENRDSLFKEAIVIASTEHGKKGKVEWEAPVFTSKPTSEKSNAEAMALDKQLQTYLTAYLAKGQQARQQSQVAAAPSSHASGGLPSQQAAEQEEAAPVDELTEEQAPVDDDVPF